MLSPILGKCIRVKARYLCSLLILLSALNTTDVQRAEESPAPITTSHQSHREKAL